MSKTPSHLKRPLSLFAITVISAGILRGLNALDMQNSALEYIAVPYFIGLSLLAFVRPQDPDLARRYRLIAQDSLIIFFGISLIFYEGFICILFALPIYFLLILFAFLTESIWMRTRKKKETKHLSLALPAIILAASIEGVTPDLSIDRTNTVVVTATSNQDIQTLRNNLLSTPILPDSRHWMLSVFPIPHKIDAESFDEGAIHTAHFTYRKWFVTNEHTGFMRLTIEDVAENQVTIRFLEDNSYLSNYLSFEQSQFTFTEKNANTTEVRLAITFERRLDPFWYFEPLERYTVSKAADYILENMVLDRGA